MGISLSTIKEHVGNSNTAQGKEEEAFEALCIIENLVGTLKDQFVRESR
jgi:hypothetical protein